MERKELLDALRQRKARLASRESLTGGRFASDFTSIPGASNVFVGGLVTYSDEAKEAFGVRKETIDAFGAVSKETARERAKQASLLFDADCSVSFTGNAGPTGSENKPVGLVYIAIKVYKTLKAYELHFDGDRSTIRHQCVDFAFNERTKRLKEDSSVKDAD